MNFRIYLDTHVDFPKPGVLFFDVSPLFADAEVFQKAVATIEQQVKNRGITKIAAIEAKGFVLGAALAMKMKTPLILIRKPELIPGKVYQEDFVKEYGTGQYQMKVDACQSEDRVLIVYDILAGPGATQAAIRLIERSGAHVAGCAYVTELAYLKGREELKGYDVFSLVTVKEKI